MTPRATAARRNGKLKAAPLSVDWLFSGTTLHRFSNEIRDRTHLHIGDRAPDHYAPVLQPGQLERIISQRPEGLREHLKLIRRDTHYDRSAGPHGVARQLHDAFGQGFTISLSGIATFWQPIARLCTAVSAHLNSLVSATAFLTPADEQGFPGHFDAYDTFILQIDGEKTWRLYEPEVALPLERHWYEIKDVDARTPRTSLTLKPGDLLYLPRGTPHIASATGRSSLHLSLVLVPYTWRDLLVDLIDEAADLDVELRRWASVTPAHDAPLPKFRQLAALLTRASVAGALERARERMVESLVPLSGEPLARQSTTVAVAPEDRLRRDDNIVLSVRPRGRRVVLTCPGDGFDAPLAAASALRFMANGPPEFAMRDVPGPLSAASNCLLATRLVRMGLLQIASRRRRAPGKRGA